MRSLPPGGWTGKDDTFFTGVLNCILCEPQQQYAGMSGTSAARENVQGGGAASSHGEDGDTARTWKASRTSWVKSVDAEPVRAPQWSSMEHVLKMCDRG